MSNEAMIEILRAVMVVMLVHLAFYYRQKRNFWRERYQKSEEYIRFIEQCEKPKRKNDDLMPGQSIEVAIPMGIDANGQVQVKTMMAYYRRPPRVSDNMPEERPEPFQSNKSLK
jgi:hypothetical protein